MVVTDQINALRALGTDPVRKLVVSGNGTRVYGILEEQACGGPACGGIVAVDIVTATSATTPPYRASFPASLDALGLPWRPLRAGDGLITGLTVASGGTINQERVDANDGGLAGARSGQQYNELGAFSSSTVRPWNGWPGSRSAGFCRSPSSPPVQHTNTVCTPWALYIAMVGAPFDASSSGWACTVSKQSRSFTE